MKTKFPHRIYVSIDSEGTQDEILLVNKTPAEVAEVNETVKVGIYVLETTGDVKALAQLVTDGPLAD